MKKIFIISLILLFLVLIFLGIYNFSFKKKEVVVQKNTPTEAIEPMALPPVAEKIKAVSAGPIFGVYIDKKKEELKYYDALTGIVWQMDMEGQKKQQITMTNVNGIKSAQWSFDGSRVLTTIQRGAETLFYMYDYTLQRSTLLKEGIDAVTWDNVGARIVYKYFDKTSKQRTLNIANADGSNWQKLSDVILRKINIAPVPLTSLMSYWNMPNSTEETQLQIIGATGGEPKTILSGKYGADYLWAPDGGKALVSSLLNKDGNSITLGLVAINGEYSALNIPTLVSKCVWSPDNKTIYYALPGGIPDNAKMPEDYQENRFNTSDTFWKMDITTGEKARIIESGDIKEKYDSSNMMLSPKGDALYFINKIDQKLYRVDLQ